MDLEKSVESSISSAWAETYGGELISRMGRDRRRKVRDAVSRAIKRNQTVKNLARTLKRDAASTRDQGRDWERVARTEVNNANAMASYELIVELYGPKTLVYRDASQCCPVCGEAFGEDKPKKWVISEIPRELRGSVHPNCFTEGHLVLTKNGLKPIQDIKVGDHVLTHMKRWKTVSDTLVRYWEGNLKSITMVNGSVLRCTPEHPFLLCGDGWVAAEKLNKGNNLIELSPDSKIIFNNMKNDPSIFGKISHFVIVLSSMLFSRVKTTPMNLYCDLNIRDGQINIEDVKGKQWDGFNSIVRKIFEKQFLKIRHNKFILNTYRSCASIAPTSGGAFNRFVSFGSNFLSIFMSAAFIPKFCCLRRISFFKITVFNDCINRASRYAKILGYFKDRFFGKVALDYGVFHLSNSLLTNPPIFSFRDSIFFKDSINCFRTTAKIRGNGRNCFKGEIARNNSFSNIDSHSAFLHNAIAAIEDVAFKGNVYNLTVEDDESFICQGIAVHNCKCSAWRVVKNPELFKAMSEPVGIVRRDGTGGYEISVGNGAWVSVGSVTARCVFRHYLSRVPFVVTDYLDRYWILRHGFGGKHKRGETILLDPRRVNNITFYHQSPFLIPRPNRAEARMVGAKTWDAYLEYMVDVLPGVIAMPEFWASDQKMRLLSDFLGYNSLTNWTITKSGEIDKAAILYQGRSESIRGLVKFYAKKLLNEDDLRKHHASKVHDKKSRDGVRGTGKRSIVYRCDR